VSMVRTTTVMVPSTVMMQTAPLPPHVPAITMGRATQGKTATTVRTTAREDQRANQPQDIAVEMVQLSRRKGTVRSVMKIPNETVSQIEGGADSWLA
jgi:hypothetical protein